MLSQLLQLIPRHVRLFWAKLHSTVGWGLLELACLVQTVLMERCRLWDLLCPRQKARRPKCSCFLWRLPFNRKFLTDTTDYRLSLSYP